MVVALDVVAVHFGGRKDHVNLTCVTHIPPLELAGTDAVLLCY